MKKKSFFVLTLILGLSCAVSLPAFANETVPLIDADSNQGSDAIGSGINADDVIKPDTTDNDAAIECLEEDCPDATTIEHEGTSGEPEVVCASEDEEGCELSDQEIPSEDTDDEEDSTEPELWPMWVSFGALSAMFVLIIMINVANRKRKK